METYIYARVLSGVVMELFTTNQPITGLFNPAMQWVDVTSANPPVQVGWLLQAGGGFAQPQAAPIVAPALTLGSVQAALTALQAQVTALVNAAAQH